MVLLIMMLMVIFKINPEIDRKVRVEAARNDMNRSEFIRKVLTETVEKTLRADRFHSPGSCAAYRHSR